MSADERRCVELQQRIALFYPGFRGGKLAARVGDALTDAGGRTALQLQGCIDFKPALRTLLPHICARVAACVRDIAGGADQRVLVARHGRIDRGLVAP